MSCATQAHLAMQSGKHAGTNCIAVRGSVGMSIVLSGVRVSSRSMKAGRTREVDVPPSTFALYVTLARAAALFNMLLGPGTRTSISKRKVQVSGFRSVLGPERKSRSTVSRTTEAGDARSIYWGRPLVLCCVVDYVRSGARLCSCQYRPS